MKQGLLQAKDLYCLSPKTRIVYYKGTFYAGVYGPMMVLPAAGCVTLPASAYSLYTTTNNGLTKDLNQNSTLIRIPSSLESRGKGL